MKTVGSGFNSKIFLDVGEIINDWTVVDCPPKGKITARCKCGTIRMKWACDFIATPSCKKCSYSKYLSSRNVDELASRQIFSSYKASAKSDGRQFELEQGADFFNLITSRCYYCNDAPSRQVIKSGRKFWVTGIDRLDSSTGYLWDNVVPCCTTCNMMKNTLGKELFLLQIEKIYLNRSQKGVDAERG